MALDSKLTKDAEVWAKHMASTGVFDHEHQQGQGANIAVMCASNAYPGYDGATDTW
jgi:hypothetical protein